MHHDIPQNLTDALWGRNFFRADYIQHRGAIECHASIDQSQIQHGHLQLLLIHLMGAQWLSGRVLDSRQRGRGFEPHRHHCVVFLEQDTFILA